MIIELTDFWEQILCHYAGGYLFCVETSNSTVRCKFSIAEMDWKSAKEEAEKPDCQIILKNYIFAIKTVQHFTRLAKKAIDGRWQSTDYVKIK